MATFKVMDKKTGLMNDILSSNMFQALYRYQVTETSQSFNLPSDLIPIQSRLRFLLIQEIASTYINQAPSRYSAIQSVKIANGKVSWVKSKLKSHAPSVIIIGVKNIG